MEKENLEQYLINHGSSNVQEDLKNINSLLSSNTQRKLLRYIKNLTKQYDITLNLGVGTGSYAAYNKRVFIQLDILNGYAPNSTLNQAFLQFQGVATHEAAHIIYSDFKQFCEIAEMSTKAQAKVPELAAKIDKTDNNVNQEILDAVFDYLYYEKLKKLVNAFEDGAIESAISRDKPETYGGIVLMRNYSSLKDLKNIKEAFNRGKTEKESLMDEIEGLMSEMHTLCVYGYREKIELNFLPKYLNKKDIRLVKWYTIFARLGAKNTAERIAMAEACLEYVKPLILKKAKEYYDSYMDALSMSPEDLLNSMANDIPTHSEFAISGQIDSSMSSMPSAPATSDYSLNLPKDIEEKIQQKLDEKNKEKQKSAESAESAELGKSGESGEEGKEGESGESGEEGEEREEGKEGKEGKEGESGEEGKEGKEGESGEEGKEGEEGEEGKGKLGSNLDSEAFDSASEINNHDIEVEANKAASAVKESLKKLGNERKIIENSNFKKEIGGGSGKAPSLSSKLSSPEILSDVHKGITTRLTPAEKINGVSREGAVAKKDQTEMNKIASTFSKKMKEILMYNEKNRIKTGLRNGKIHQAGLYRAKTDTKIFKKKTEGHICKARICLLMDESGSMSGKKMTDAIKSAYIMATACSKINVPISVFGHNTAKNNCSLNQYVDFRHCKDKNYIEKIFASSAGSSNHDGLAIFHSLSDLARNRKKDELLFMLVVSDGAPAGFNGYWGDVAFKDIMATYTKFEKEFNIKTIGIGIGDDVASVPEIYKNNIIVPNVEKLSDELLKLLRNIVTS